MDVSGELLNMMEQFVFTPSIKTIDCVAGIAPISAFALEPSIFSGTPDFVHHHGGPISKKITNSILDYINKLPEYYPTIDIRVQRLMPGMWPSIPGWHCDDFFRRDYSSQPDLHKPDSKVEHYTCIVSSEPNVSRTEWIDAPLMAHIDLDDEIVPVWRQLHREVEQQPSIKRSVLYEGQIVHFNQQAIHRASKCYRRGHRLFYRLSMRPRPSLGGMITTQQQVYIQSEESGW